MADSNGGIVREIVVGVSREAAFEAFTSGLGEWWPSAYTWSGEKLVEIGIEEGFGGHCYEIGPFAFRCDWGRVLGWDPPDRVVLSWQIGPQRVPQPDPDRASVIEVRFDAQARDRTRVVFEHREFERHGQDGMEYRQNMDSARGWTWILDCFAQHVNGG
jgi:uncharacterized protein YndB with AHSA1/START domain